MENTNQNLDLVKPIAAPPAKKHYKSFWPIMIIAVISSLIGGFLVWTAYNIGLDEEISSLWITPKIHSPLNSPPYLGGDEGEVKDWQTYRNEEYGFEFKYPSSLLKIPNKDSVFMIQNTSLPLQLGGMLSREFKTGIEGQDFMTEGYQYSVEIQKKSDLQNYIKNHSDTSSQDLKLTNVVGRRYDLINQVSRGPFVTINHPNYPDIYLIFRYQASCFDKTICNDSDVDSLFNQILSTFKFIEPMSDWQTYRNEEYGVEFKYPESLSPKASSELKDGGLVLETESGNHVIVIIRERPFNPALIEHLYGEIEDAKPVFYNSVTWYQFGFGDAGCGGPVYQTSLKSQILEVAFIDCEESGEPMVNDQRLIDQVLSTFKFIK